MASTPDPPPKVIVTLPQLLFSHEELACPKTGIVRLADGFARHLVELRVAYGRPMKVNSCCRSKAHNETVKGHSNSLHVYDDSAHGLNGAAAIDIAIADPVDRGALVILAWRMGWSIGHAKTFLHLDRRDLAGLPQGMFGY